MTVILSAKASRQLENLFDYLEINWSPIGRHKFQQRLDRFIQVIKAMPRSFPESATFPNCRKCVISPQTSLYYRFEGEIIEIVAVQDNRQVP